MAQNIKQLSETTGGLQLQSVETKPDGALEVSTNALRDAEFKARFLPRLDQNGRIRELRLAMRDPATQRNPYADVEPTAR